MTLFDKTLHRVEDNIFKGITRTKNIKGTNAEAMLLKHSIDPAGTCLRYTQNKQLFASERCMDALSIPVEIQGEIVGLYHLLFDDRFHFFEDQHIGHTKAGYAITKIGRPDAFIITEGVLEGLMLEAELGEGHTVIATLSSEGMARFILPKGEINDLIIGIIPDYLGNRSGLRLAHDALINSPDLALHILPVPPLVP